MAKGSSLEITTSGALDSGELQAIRARCQNESAGPWKFSLEGRNHLAGDDAIFTYDNDLYLPADNPINDWEFIANARQDVPKLISEIERLQSLVKILEEGKG